MIKNLRGPFLEHLSLRYSQSKPTVDSVQLVLLQILNKKYYALTNSVMTNKRKVTRQSSCGLLGLPTDLACQYCVNSITKASTKGIRAKRIKKMYSTMVAKVVKPSRSRESEST